MDPRREAEVEANYCVDLAQVYVGGFSSGGWESYMLGCAASDLVRGIGAEEGGERAMHPTCKNPVAAVLVAGQADTENPIGPLTLDSDAGKRLGCFDREIAALRPPEPEQQAVQDSRAEFGLSEKLKGGSEKPQKETDRVAAVTQRPNAALMISLENGQVWKATEQEYFPVNVGDSVTIYAGAWGRFWLSTAGTNSTVRVTRVGR